MADNSISSRFWTVSPPQQGTEKSKTATCVDCGKTITTFSKYSFYPTPDSKPIRPLCKADFDRRVEEWKKSELLKLFPNFRVTDWAIVYACMDKK